jgi:hypothetical protein
MSDAKCKPLDIYLAGNKCENIAPGKLVKGIRGAGNAAKRMDAFEESKKEGWQRDSRRK